jgi:hypothetical protein
MLNSTKAAVTAYERAEIFSSKCSCQRKESVERTRENKHKLEAQVFKTSWPPWSYFLFPPLPSFIKAYIKVFGAHPMTEFTNRTPLLADCWCLVTNLWPKWLRIRTTAWIDILIGLKETRPFCCVGLSSLRILNWIGQSPGLAKTKNMAWGRNEMYGFEKRISKS